MTHRKISLRLFKRLLTLVLMIGALVFAMSDHSVRADDCSTAMFALEICNSQCGSLPTYEQKQQCYHNCYMSHAYAGATCSMPNHSPMMITGGGCDPAANGQRAYDNCIAGTLQGSWQEQYLIYMAYYDDIEISCGMIAQGVEAQGCF